MSIPGLPCAARWTASTLCTTPSCTHHRQRPACTRVVTYIPERRSPRHIRPSAAESMSAAESPMNPSGRTRARRRLPDHCRSIETGPTTRALWAYHLWNDGQSRTAPLITTGTCRLAQNLKKFRAVGWRHAQAHVSCASSACRNEHACLVGLSTAGGTELDCWSTVHACASALWHV